MVPTPPHHSGCNCRNEVQKVYEKLKVAKYDNWGMKRVLLGKSISIQKNDQIDSSMSGPTACGLSPAAPEDDLFRAVESLESLSNDGTHVEDMGSVRRTQD